jgi:hypothetical protein
VITARQNRLAEIRHWAESEPKTSDDADTLWLLGEVERLEKAQLESYKAGMMHAVGMLPTLHSNAVIAGLMIALCGQIHEVHDSLKELP